MKPRHRQTIRLILGAAVVIAVLVAVNFLVVAPVSRPQFEAHPMGTTYSAAADGAELVYRLFTELGFEVHQHRHPLVRNLTPPGIDVIWHMWGTVQVGENEIEWVDEWVRDGGTLILIDNPLMRDITSSESYGRELNDKLLKHWFENLGLSARTIDVEPIGGGVAGLGGPHRQVVGMSAVGELGEVNQVHTYKRRGLLHPMVYRLAFTNASVESTKPVIRDGYGTVLAASDIGNGRVWIVADPYFFSNLLVQEADNAIVATSLIVGSRDGEFSSILFDEYHLGYVQTRSLADAAGTPLGRTILYLGMILVLALGTAGARLGPIRKAPGALGVSQRAFVSALGGLWQGANATTAAADALWKRYRPRQEVKRRGLDVELDTMRKARPRMDELIEIARKLDS